MDEKPDRARGVNRLTDERRLEILRMHDRYVREELTLVEVGDLYGIGAERVRQLFVALRLPTRTRREAAEARRRRARRDALN